MGWQGGQSRDLGQMQGKLGENGGKMGQQPRNAECGIRKDPFLPKGWGGILSELHRSQTLRNAAGPVTRARMYCC